MLIIFLIFASSVLAIVLYFYNPERNLRVNFLDVGQGDAVLIQTPYDQNILIDGGDADSKILRQLPKFMPFWDREIDLMVLTHPHDDHVGGLVKVAERYKVKKILYTGVVHNSPAYLAWLAVVRDKNIPVTIIDRPQTIALGEDLKMEILYPFESLLNKEVENLNNSSIVAKLIYKNNSFLFSGDAEMEIEQELLGAGIDLSADVFKAGHHGSDTSNSESFIDAVQPDYVIIQVGEDNDFGHPSLRVLKRFERIGAEVCRNDLDGWVQVVSDGNELIINKEK
ncbi:MAG: MBL fold metallo-hydrolase [Patescibacteria group bacterium]|jgi:competence protein ComEC